jgi:hypothetical protein
VNITPVIVRLAARCPSLIDVGPAQSLEPLETLEKYPAAGVYSGEREGQEDWGETLDQTEVTQYDVHTLEILLAADNYVVDSIETVEQEVDAALRGWVPDAGYDPLRFVSSVTLVVAGVLQWRQMTYQTKILVSYTGA